MKSKELNEKIESSTNAGELFRMSVVRAAVDHGDKDGVNVFKDSLKLIERSMVDVAVVVCDTAVVKSSKKDCREAGKRYISTLDALLMDEELGEEQKKTIQEAKNWAEDAVALLE